MWILILPVFIVAFSRASDPQCEEGIAEHNPMQDGDACCAKACGKCGGHGCSQLPGGKTECCGSIVRKAGKSCDSNDPPCVVSPSPAPPPPSPRPPPPQSVNVTVSPEIVSETDTRYVGWTIDLSGGRQFFKLDFTNETLKYLASQLPTFTRVGGSGQDYLSYGFDKPCVGTGGCLNTTQWDALHAFVIGAGSKMVFGLNDCTRSSSVGTLSRALTTCKTTAGSWDDTQAKSLLTYAKAHGQEIFGVSLGNERDSQVKASEQAKDFVQLDKLLCEMYPEAASRPKLLGPGAHSFKDKRESWSSKIAYLQDFIKAIVKAHVQMYAITHHEYTEIISVGGAPDFNDPAVLNRTSDVATLFNRTVASALPQARRWGGEIGPHNGGSSVCSHKQMRWANFADSIWYADALGAKALHGYHVFARQDFVGIDYGLLDCVDHTPLPDYYVAVLFYRLMGTKVLAAKVEPEDQSLRAYVHCGKRAGYIVLLLVHLAKGGSQTISVSGTEGTIYSLTAHGGDPLTVQADLNGHLLSFAGGKLPDLSGAPIDATKAIQLPPLSVTFLELRINGVCNGAAPSIV